MADRRVVLKKEWRNTYHKDADPEVITADIGAAFRTVEENGWGSVLVEMREGKVRVLEVVLERLVKEDQESGRGKKETGV